MYFLNFFLPFVVSCSFSEVIWVFALPVGFCVVTHPHHCRFGSDIVFREGVVACQQHRRFSINMLNSNIICIQMESLLLLFASFLTVLGILSSASVSVTQKFCFWKRRLVSSPWYFQPSLLFLCNCIMVFSRLFVIVDLSQNALIFSLFLV